MQVIALLQNIASLLSCVYLAHHELESIVIIIITTTATSIVIIIIIIIIMIFMVIMCKEFRV